MLLADTFEIVLIGPKRRSRAIGPIRTLALARAICVERNAMIDPRWRLRWEPTMTVRLVRPIEIETTPHVPAVSFR